MKRPEPITRSISKYLKQTLPILNNDFCYKNKITSISRVDDTVTVTTENPHTFSSLQSGEALFMSGVKSLFDFASFEIVGQDIKIQTSAPHNIGQDAILSIELIGFTNIGGIYENQRKILQPMDNTIFLPRSLFQNIDFTGINRKIAIHTMRYNEQSYNRYLKGTDVTVINSNQFSYLVDAREAGTPYLSTMDTEFAYLKSLANVIEVRDLYTGINSIAAEENQDFKDHCILVARTGGDIAGNPDHKFGTNFAANGNLCVNDTILIWILFNTASTNITNHRAINETIDYATNDINNLMSQFRRFYVNKSDYTITSISYGGDTVVDLRNQEGLRSIFECQELRFNIVKLAAADKFSELDQSLAFSDIQAFFNGVNTPIVSSI